MANNSNQKFIKVGEQSYPVIEMKEVKETVKKATKSTQKSRSVFDQDYEPGAGFYVIALISTCAMIYMIYNYMIGA
jgi:hypothetical protein